MKTAKAALAWLLDPTSQVSCHYLVFEDGRTIQMVAEARRAWHAGRARWEAISDVNSHSIGIEIVNPGHDWGYRDFPHAQMDALAALSADIVGRWQIRPEHVLAHSDVAPERKDDPGERLDWKHLADQGVGLWTRPGPIRAGALLSLGDAGEPVEALQAMLMRYGYGLAVTGRFDAPTQAVVRAFQRHFRQERVDGVADLSTIETLRDLLTLRSRLA
jgi:N-acetylmuramoyl-L-alanine amidase